MNNKLGCLAVIILALAFTSTASAGSDSGFYIGGSVGSSSVDYSDNDPSFGDFDIDDDDNGYKVFGGFNFGIIPLLDLAVEATYYDFGTFEGEATLPILTGFDADANGYSVAGLLSFNLGFIGLFGKAGIADWETDVSGFDFSDDGTDPLYGIGAKFFIGSFQIRAEYEMFDFGDIDLDYISVGGAFTF